MFATEDVFNVHELHKCEFGAPNPLCCLIFEMQNANQAREDFLANKTHSYILKAGDDRICPICKIEYHQPDEEVPPEIPVCIETCKHIFGAHCLRRHVYMGELPGQAQCPLCRAELYATSSPNTVRNRGILHLIEGGHARRNAVINLQTPAQTVDERAPSPPAPARVVRRRWRELLTEQQEEGADSRAGTQNTGGPPASRTVNERW